MPSISTLKLPQQIHTAASAVDKFRRARATRLHPSHAPLLWRSCRHRERAACILSSKCHICTLPRGRQGLDVGSVPRTIVVLPLVKFSRMPGGGQAHVNLKISSGNSSGTKAIGARKACCHSLSNQDSKWEIFHIITTAADAGATAECQNSESASLARRSNCLEAEAVAEDSSGGDRDGLTFDSHGSCIGGGGGVSET